MFVVMGLEKKRKKSGCAVGWLNGVSVVVEKLGCNHAQGTHGYVFQLEPPNRHAHTNTEG